MRGKRKKRPIRFMNKPVLSVREMERADIGCVSRYWINADPPFLLSLGVDPAKLPAPDQLNQMLSEQIRAPIEEKQSYWLIWQMDGRPIGHSNARPIVFGKEAYMHLHLWELTVRRQGLGAELVRMSLPWYFQSLRLEKIYCEPYALNAAPNRVLEKVGFDFVKEYTTIPGFLNFEQPVKRWELSYEKFKRLK